MLISELGAPSLAAFPERHQNLRDSPRDSLIAFPAQQPRLPILGPIGRGFHRVDEILSIFEHHTRHRVGQRAYRRHLPMNARPVREPLFLDAQLPERLLEHQPPLHAFRQQDRIRDAASQ